MGVAASFSEGPSTERSFEIPEEVHVFKRSSNSYERIRKQKIKLLFRPDDPPIKSPLHTAVCSKYTIYLSFFHPEPQALRKRLAALKTLLNLSKEIPRPSSLFFLFFQPSKPVSKATTRQCSFFAREIRDHRASYFLQ